MFQAPAFWPQLDRDLAEHRERLSKVLRDLLGPEAFERLRELDESFLGPDLMLLDENRPVNTDNSREPLESSHPVRKRWLLAGGLDTKVFSSRPTFGPDGSFEGDPISTRFTLLFSRRGLCYEGNLLGIRGFPPYQHAFPPYLAYYIRLYLQFMLYVLQNPSVYPMVEYGLNCLDAQSPVSPANLDRVLRGPYAQCSSDDLRLVAHAFPLGYNQLRLNRYLAGRLVYTIEQEMGYQLAEPWEPFEVPRSIHLEAIDEQLPILGSDPFDYVPPCRTLEAAFRWWDYGLIPLTAIQEKFVISYQKIPLTMSQRPACSHFRPTN